MNVTPADLTAIAIAQFWQVTAVCLLVGVATRLACRHRPHLAYLLWMLVILKAVTPPLWASPTGLFSWIKRDVVAQAAAPVAEPAAARSEPAPVLGPSGGLCGSRKKPIWSRDRCPGAARGSSSTGGKRRVIRCPAAQTGGPALAFDGCRAGDRLALWCLRVSVGGRGEMVADPTPLAGPGIGRRRTAESGPRPIGR